MNSEAYNADRCRALVNVTKRLVQCKATLAEHKPIKVKFAKTDKTAFTIDNRFVFGMELVKRTLTRELINPDIEPEVKIIKEVSFPENPTDDDIKGEFLKPILGENVNPTYE